NFPDQPVSIISISTFGLDDVYVFVSSVDGADATSVRVFVNPLTPLVWMGGALMLLGGILCWWPERRRRPALIEQPVRREREAVTPRPRAPSRDHAPSRSRPLSHPPRPPP